MNEYVFTSISDNTPMVQSVLFACFHAFFFALPINAPNLLCFTNLISEGIGRGALSYLILSFSQTVFISAIVYGGYNLIQIWYDFEPFLFLLGSVLTFQIVCASFTSDTAPTSEVEGSTALGVSGGGKTYAMSSMVHLLRSFKPDRTVSAGVFRRQLILIFVLQLCNPVCLFQPTRYVTSFEITSVNGSADVGSGAFTSCTYLLAFFIAMWVFSTLIGRLIQIGAECTLVLPNVSALQGLLGGTRGGQRGSRWQRPIKNWPITWVSMRGVIAIFVSTLLFAAISKYTWRIFVQYPPDAIGTEFNIERLRRELPARESGIRRRFIDNPSIGRPRRIPIEEFSEALQVMREEKSSKSEKIHLYFDEESKRSREQIIVRFKSHFINRFITRINEARVSLRTPFNHNKTIEQIELLQPANAIEADKETNLPESQGEKRTYAIDENRWALTHNGMNNNKKKGKTKYGYLTLQRK